VEEMQSNSAIISSLQQSLSVSPMEMLERVKGLLAEKKHLEKKLKQKKSSASLDIDLLADASTVDKYQVIVKKVSTESIDELKEYGDQLFQKLSTGIGILFMQGEEKPSAVIVVSKDLNSSGILAGNLAKEIGSFMGGGGGGKPHLATAGGKDNSSVDSAMSKTLKLITEKLKG
jgi:alanyl-tRNA synthetase